jgi:hypothetical protein
MSDNRPMALSVEKIRHEMLRGILVPREMVNAALLKTFTQLEAKETKFFSFKGHVTETAEVDDNATQAAAADKIFSLAGLYAREREDRVSTPGVAMEIDPVTGVVRIIVGAPALSLSEPTMQELPPVECSPSEQPVVVVHHDIAPSRSQASTRRAAASNSAMKILFDETVE